jgi:hypothetical protein
MAHVIHIKNELVTNSIIYSPIQRITSVVCERATCKIE